MEIRLPIFGEPWGNNYLGDLRTLKYQIASARSASTTKNRIWPKFIAGQLENTESTKAIPIAYPATTMIGKMDSRTGIVAQRFTLSPVGSSHQNKAVEAIAITAPEAASNIVSPPNKDPDQNYDLRDDTRASVQSPGRRMAD
jgi:hypothetical protein